MSDKKYPIAEIFSSPQGEGLYAGQLQTFIRFAGCSVGKKMTQVEREDFTKIDNEVTGLRAELPVYREKCTTYDDRVFACDTNFQTKEVLTVAQILERVPRGVNDICFTGGEPLDQPLEPFLSYIEDKTGLNVHIETSGTVDIRRRALPSYDGHQSLGHDGGWIWITVSPKKNVLPEMIELADEIKLLVDENFDIGKLPAEILMHDLVWLQPINAEYQINVANMNRCLELQKQFPAWRISSQSHKLWNVR